MRGFGFSRRPYTAKLTRKSVARKPLGNARRYAGQPELLVRGAVACSRQAADLREPECARGHSDLPTSSASFVGPKPRFDSELQCNSLPENLSATVTMKGVS